MHNGAFKLIVSISRSRSMQQKPEQKQEQNRKYSKNWQHQSKRIVPKRQS